MHHLSVGGALRRWSSAAAAAAATACLVGVAWLAPASGAPAAASATEATLSPPAGTTVSYHTMVVGARTREWLEVVPAHPASSSIPIMMVLHGIDATAAGEAKRDGFLPLASDGQVELVYPSGVDESWNAGGCCGQAGQLDVDDVSFLERLVSTVDPGHHRPLYLVGYSNGGRMAYTLACDDPSLLTSVAVMDAVPGSGCTLDHPVTIVQLDGTADKEVPYAPGDAGHESPPATVLVAHLERADRCTGTAVSATLGTLELDDWTRCSSGTRLEFASFVGLGHGWFAGSSTTPSEAAVIWAFFEHKQPA